MESWEINKVFIVWLIGRDRRYIKYNHLIKGNIYLNSSIFLFLSTTLKTIFIFFNV